MRVGRFLASSRSLIVRTPCHPQGFSRPSRWEAIVGALHGCAEPSSKAASCEFGEGDWWSRAAFPVSTATRPLRCNTLLRDAASALAQLRVSSLPTTASTASAGCTSQPPGRDEYVSVGVIEHREMFLYLEAMSDVNAQTKLREVLWPPASRLHRQILVKARHALRSAVEEIQSCGLCGPSQESIRKGLGMTEAHMLDELFSLSDNLPASRVTAPMQTTGLPVTKEVSVEHAFCFTSRMAPHWSRACSLRRGVTGVSRECDGVHRTPSVSKRCYDVLWEHFEFLLADMVELRILIANAVELEVILAEASYLRRSFHHQPLSADSPEAHEQLRRMCSLVLRSALWGRQGLDQLHVAAAVARFRECCSFVCPEDAASPNHLCTSVQRLYQAVRLHLRHTWDEPSSETPANTLPQGQPSRIAQRKKIKRKKSDLADNSLMAALLMGSKQ